MIKQATLSDTEREQIIESYPQLIASYKNLYNYRADMICLDPNFEYLEFVLSKFKNIHYHYENEHWYILDGSCSFGFLGHDGRKFIVNICAGEYLTVPERKWQWIVPPPDNRMKAIRFFNCTNTVPEPQKLDFA